MLCTPPAFILSQDQTLYELLLNAPCEALILFCSAYFKFKRNQRVPYISCDTYVYNLLLCTLCCSVFNVRSRSPLSGTALLSYHNFFHLSIGFLNFFQIFFGDFLKSLALSTLLLYHNFWEKSIGSFHKIKRNEKYAFVYFA